VADREGNVLKVPSTSQKAEVKGQEILASYARFTQKGVTLAGSQGVLEAGTLLARNSSTKKYVKYDNDGANDTDVCRGVLRNAVDTGSTDILANIVVSGIVKAALVATNNSFASGVSDADYLAAVVDLNGRLDTVSDMFIF